MSDYKYIADILSSMAAIIAISAALWSWLRSAQCAIIIERFLIKNCGSESTYILCVKNRMPYPVEIKSINAFTKRSYRVEQKKNQGPKYAAILSFSDSIFTRNEIFEINASASADIIITNVGPTCELNRIIFSMQTSHGYHKILCKNIILICLSTQIFGMANLYESSSELNAKAKFYWLIILSLFK